VFFVYTITAPSFLALRFFFFLRASHSLASSPAGLPTGALASWLAFQVLAGWLADWQAGWLAGWLAGAHPLPGLPSLVS